MTLQKTEFDANNVQHYIIARDRMYQYSKDRITVDYKVASNWRGHTFMVIWSIVILSVYCSTVTLAQEKTDLLPAVSIKDSVFEKVLAEYTKVAGTNEVIVAVFLERYDNDYTYTLYDFGLYDEIKNNSTANFGRWKTHTLLFYTGLEGLVAYIDTAKANQINRYLRVRLPDANVYKPDPNDPKLVEMITTVHDPNIWRFKVRDGKLLWLRRGLGYQSERVPYMKYNN